MMAFMMVLVRSSLNKLYNHQPFKKRICKFHRCDDVFICLLHDLADVAPVGKTILSCRGIIKSWEFKEVIEVQKVKEYIYGRTLE